MSLQFIDPTTGETVGSTALGRAVLAASVTDVDGQLSDKLAKQTEWRKTYQSAFASVAMAEFKSSSSMIEIATKGLTQFEKSVVTDSGEPLIDVVRTAWRANKDLVATVVIKGLGEKLVPGLLGAETLGQMVQKHSAEE